MNNSPKTATHYQELEKQLRAQLALKPHSRELRVKLLELFYETGREQEFLREAKTFRDSIRDNLDAPDWRMIATIGRALAPTSPLFVDAGTPERFEYTGAGAPLAPTAAPARRYRRLGEGKELKRHFDALAVHYQQALADPRFLDSVDRELLQIGGRPSSLFLADRLSRQVGGAQIYCKREDLSAPGTNLLMAVVGQALLAKRLGRKTLVTGTVYGQKGVMTASIAARLGLEAVVYMDGDDIHKQAGNVFRMWVMGASVESVDVRELPGKDVREAALRHWIRAPEDCFLVLGLDAGPEPYPSMTRDFTAAIGRECRRQVMTIAKRSPDVVVARGRSCADAINLFPPMIADARTRLVCVDAQSSLEERAPARGEDDVYAREQQLTDQQKRIADAILEGLEYPSVTREHQWLEGTGRVEYVKSSADEAKRAIRDFSRLEGIVPAIQTAHAIAWASRTAATLAREQVVVVHINERVEKDIWDIGKALGMQF